MTEATEDPTGGGKTPGEAATVAGIEPEVGGSKVPVIPAGKAPGTVDGEPEEVGEVKGGKIDPAGGGLDPTGGNPVCRSVKISTIYEM